MLHNEENKHFSFVKEQNVATLNVGRTTVCGVFDWTSGLTQVSGTGYSMLHQLGCAFTEDVPQRMDRTSYHAGFTTKEPSTVQQSVVLSDGGRAAWSSTSRQSAEKCDKTSASRDSSTEAVAVLQGWVGNFTLWLRRILTCNGCQGLGSATLKVWQLVDAKYWIIYGGTNKFQATVDSGAEWFLMGRWSGNLVKRAADEYLIQSVRRVQSRSDQCVMRNESKQRSGPKKREIFSY